MKKIFLILPLLALITSCGNKNQKPLDPSSETHLTEVGDMIIEKEYVIDEHSDLSSQVFKMKKVNKWPNGELVYKFTRSVNNTQRKEFIEFCKELGDYAEVSCRPRTSADSDYVLVKKTSSGACGSSYLGRYGGAQTLKVRCWRRRTVQHELMHALGISHEHNRFDRDKFITLLPENMKQSVKKSFRRVALIAVDEQLDFYDFKSVMHYDSLAGSKNGKAVFYITSLGPNSGLIPLAREMSYGDHLGLVMLYGGQEPNPGDF